MIEHSTLLGIINWKKKGSLCFSPKSIWDQCCLSFFSCVFFILYFTLTVKMALESVASLLSLVWEQNNDWTSRLQSGISIVEKEGTLWRPRLINFGQLCYGTHYRRRRPKRAQKRGSLISKIGVLNGHTAWNNKLCVIQFLSACIIQDKLWRLSSITLLEPLFYYMQYIRNYFIIKTRDLPGECSGDILEYVCYFTLKTLRISYFFQTSLLFLFWFPLRFGLLLQGEMKARIHKTSTVKPSP